MELITSLAALSGVVLFCLVMAALGHRLLRWSGLKIGSELEHLLYSAAAGVIACEAAMALVECSGQVKTGIPAVLILAAALGAPEYPAIQKSLTVLIRSAFAWTKEERCLAALIALALLFEGIAAVAPLTGSDALHYHFTAPLLVLREGFHPNFFLSHSFFTGQGHLLILAGLALGSEKLALGLLFLGGALAAAATACLARKWTTRSWALLAALAFLLTPVVFWQITTAGAPDIWMAFFATMGVLIVARVEKESSAGVALLAGILAGAIAGTKYTGCIIAASLALAFFWETRSVRRAVQFLCGALAAGIWPFARNAIWTGDPVFPFLLQRLHPAQVNAHTLAAVLADTGAAGSRSLLQLVKFPLFAAVDPSHAGFWQFLGPLCLVFAPLLLFVVRNTPQWRTALFVWFVSSIGIGATSGMLRFLLPILPVALAAVFASVAALHTQAWRIARALSIATIAGFLVLGAGGLFAYERDAVVAAVGLTSREDYLSQRAPDYAKAEFVNRFLNEKGIPGITLVFFRHVYDLRVPFVYGHPDASWAIDPDRLRTKEAWRALFRREKIRWVVRAPDYPAEIAGPLRQLEADGDLAPIAQSEVSDFVGMRILGVRKSDPIVILQVKD